MVYSTSPTLVKCVEWVGLFIEHSSGRFRTTYNWIIFVVTIQYVFDRTMCGP